MADRVQWTLELIDKLSGPGRSCAAAFEHLTDAQVEAMAAARRLANMEDRSAAALKEVTSGVRKLTAEDLDLVDATRKARREFEAADRATSGLQRTAGRSMTGSLLEAAIWENLARGILRATRAVVEYTARAAFAVGMKFFDAAVWAEDTESSLAVLAGSTAKGNREFEQITATAKRMGLSIRDTAGAYKGLRAAQFSATEATDFVKLGADLQTVVGASDDAVQRFFLSTTQIKAKGRLQAEELMQIQEAVNLSQGAITEQLAKSLGKSTEDIVKLQAAGKITADQGIAAIKAATLELVHANKAGEATEREVDKTLKGLVRLAKSGAEAWQISVGKRLMPAFNSLAERIVDTFEKFDKAGKFGKFTDAVVLTFERFVGAIEDAWPRIERLFGRGIDDMTDGLLDLSRSFDSMLDKVLDVAEFVQDHWTAVKTTFVAGSAVVAMAMTAIAGRSVVSGIKTVIDLVKGLASAYKSAAAAKAALAAVEMAKGGGGIPGAGIPAMGAGGRAMKATGAVAKATKGASVAGRVAGVATKALPAVATAVPAVAGLAGGAGTAGAAQTAGVVAAGAATAGAASFAGPITALLIASTSLGWNAYKLWQENQDFDLFDVKLIGAKLKADFEAFMPSLQEIGERGIYPVMFDMGIRTAGALASGVRSAISDAADAAVSLGSRVLGAFKGTIGAKSPPKAFVELGEGSAAAFISGLQTKLPDTLYLGLGATVAANDVGLPKAMASAEMPTPSAAPVAVAAVPESPLPSVPAAETAVTRLLGGLERVVAGLGVSAPSATPANDIVDRAPQPVTLPVAVGHDVVPPERPQQATAGFRVERGASYGGGSQVFQISINVTVEGNASKEDADALAESMRARLMPSVRAEIQRTLTNAGGSAT